MITAESLLKKSLIEAETLIEKSDFVLVSVAGSEETRSKQLNAIIVDLKSLGVLRLLEENQIFAQKNVEAILEPSQKSVTIAKNQLENQEANPLMNIFIVQENALLSQLEKMLLKTVEEEVQKI